VRGDSPNRRAVGNRSGIQVWLALAHVPDQAILGRRDMHSTAQRNHDGLKAMGRSVLASGELGQHNGALEFDEAERHVIQQAAEAADRAEQLRALYRDELARAPEPRPATKRSASSTRRTKTLRSRPSSWSCGWRVVKRRSLGDDP